MANSTPKIVGLAPTQDSNSAPTIVGLAPNTNIGGIVQPLTPDDSTSLGTLLKSGATTGLQNFWNLLQLALPKNAQVTHNVQNAFPDLKVSKYAQSQFPIAQKVGELAGNVASAAPLFAAPEALIPSLASGAEDTLGATLLKNAIKGGSVGAETATPGDRLSGAIMGASLGAGLGVLPRVAASGNNFVSGTLNTIKNWNDPTDIIGRTAQADAENAAQQQAIKDATANVQSLGGNASPELTEANIAKNKNDIDSMKSILDSIPGSADYQDVEDAFPGMSPDMRSAFADSAVQSAKSNLDDANAQQAQELGVGQNHSNRLGMAIKNAIQNIRDSFKPRYQQINDALEGRKVTNPTAGTQNPDFIEDLISSLPSEYQNDGNVVDALQSVKSGSDQISAPQLIDLYRAAKASAAKATGNGNAYGVGADVQAAWRAQAAKLNKVASSYRSVMENELPKDVLADFDKTQSDYSDQVMPFYKNGAFSIIDKEGKVPSNFIDNTSGSLPHQVIMQKLIQSDPEMTRLALGQKYASNPSDLLNYDENSDPYIQSYQPAKNLMLNQTNALQNLKNAQNMSDNVKQIDPIYRAQTKLQALQDAHNARMQELQKGEVTAQKLSQLKQESDNFIAAKNKVKSSIWKALGGGFLYYGLHRKLWDLLSL